MVEKVLAIVPARSGSKGLPGKNLRLLGGKPLVAWPIAAAMNASSVNKVIVSTDDTSIADVAIKAGAEVPFLRPPSLADDNASSMDVVLHALETLASEGEDFDYVVLLEPTSPLTMASDIESALNRLILNRAEADAIVGVCRVEATHPEYDVRINENSIIRPYISEDFKPLPRRQDLEEIYFMEGSLYISSVESFYNYKTFYHDRTMGYEVPRWQSMEVDDIFDFIVIEAVVRNLDEIREVDASI